MKSPMQSEVDAYCGKNGKIGRCESGIVLYFHRLVSHVQQIIVGIIRATHSFKKVGEQTYIGIHHQSVRTHAMQNPP
jgi:hypothetical protein